jgi:hypothetical protein
MYLLSSAKKIFIRGDMPSNQQKRVTVLLVIVGIVLGLLLSMFLYSRYVVWALKSPERFRREVGYQLPEHAQITYTEAHIFSLVDGPNYTWLITSERSLRSWANQVGWRIGPDRGSWEHVTSFYEVAPYTDEFTQLSLGGVWRTLAHSQRGRDETSYIFLAGNDRVACIETFRP